MAEEKEVKEVELTDEEIQLAKEQSLLTWLISQILANETYMIAETVIAESALITARNMKALDAGATKFEMNKAKKNAKEFIERVRFDSDQYTKFSTKLPGYIQRSPRYEKVLKDVIPQIAEFAGEKLKESLEKNK